MNVLGVIDLSLYIFLLLNRTEMSFFFFFAFPSSAPQTKAFACIVSEYILIFPPQSYDSI